MNVLLGLARVLPDAAVRQISLLQHRLPVVKPLYRRLGRSTRLSDQLVRSGPAKGLRLRAEHAALGYLLGTVEPEVQRLIAGIVRPRQIAYDIGANVGFFTLLLARGVGATGRVYAFEPLPANADALERNVRLNAVSNVTLIRSAVSRGRGVVALAVPAEDTAQVSVDPAGNGLRVPSLSLDEFVFADGHAAPDVVKIDVEGHECEVILGMTRILLKYKPVLICEVHGTNVELAKRLTEVGYIAEVVGEPGVPLAVARGDVHVLARAG